MEIEANPTILGGKPVVKGTRIPVDLILELIDHGYSPRRIQRSYPELTRETILQIADLAKRVHESVRYPRVKRLVPA